MRAVIACLVLLAALAGQAFAAGGAQSGPPQGFKCNECHSKNPKLYAMHLALDFSNCGICHQTAVRSISAMRMSEEEKRNRTTDPRCKTCHTK